MNKEELVVDYYKTAVKDMKESFFVSENDDWYNFVMSLPQKERLTYIIIVTNQEVFNGGFDQYFVNTYGRFAYETVMALVDIGAPKRARIVDAALRKVNHQALAPEEFRRALVTRQIPALFQTHELIEILSPLDDEYCEMEDEDIVEKLGSFLEEK